MKYGLLASIAEGGRQTATVAGEVWFAVKGLVTGRISPKELGGPIQIGQLSGQVVRMGIDRLFWFMAYFSVNLAVLNLLPYRCWTAGICSSWSSKVCGVGRFQSPCGFA